MKIKEIVKESSTIRHCTVLSIKKIYYSSQQKFHCAEKNFQKIIQIWSVATDATEIQIQRTGSCPILAKRRVCVENCIYFGLFPNFSNNCVSKAALLGYFCITVSISSLNSATADGSCIALNFSAAILINGS